MLVKTELLSEEKLRLDIPPKPRQIASRTHLMGYILIRARIAMCGFHIQRAGLENAPGIGVNIWNVSRVTIFRNAVA